MDDALVRELRSPQPFDENKWLSLMTRAADRIEMLSRIAGPIALYPSMAELKAQMPLRTGDVDVQITTVK